MNDVFNIVVFAVLMLTLCGVGVYAMYRGAMQLEVTDDGNWPTGARYAVVGEGGEVYITGDGFPLSVVGFHLRGTTEFDDIVRFDVMTFERWAKRHDYTNPRIDRSMIGFWYVDRRDHEQHYEPPGYNGDMP